MYQLLYTYILLLYIYILSYYYVFLCFLWGVGTVVQRFCTPLCFLGVYGVLYIYRKLRTMYHSPPKLPQRTPTNSVLRVEPRWDAIDFSVYRTWYAPVQSPYQVGV